MPVWQDRIPARGGAASTAFVRDAPTSPTHRAEPVADAAVPLQEAADCPQPGNHQGRAAGRGQAPALFPAEARLWAAIPRRQLRSPLLAPPSGQRAMRMRKKSGCGRRRSLVVASKARPIERPAKQAPRRAGLPMLCRRGYSNGTCDDEFVGPDTVALSQETQRFHRQRRGSTLSESDSPWK